MDWNSFLGHDRQRRWFQNAIAGNRLASTFLMVGPDGIGKRTFATLIAKTMLCNRNSPASFSPCGECESCAQINAKTHPDLIEIKREPEKTALTMNQLVGEGEMRMRAGLCYEIRMRPYSGKRKIAILDDADTLAEEGANALLKTLEEPPLGAIIFLISASVQRQLPTIRSRCQMVRFQPLPVSAIKTLILRSGITDDMSIADQWANNSNGSMASMDTWSDESLRSFCEQFVAQLQSPRLDFPKLAKAIMGHLDSLGTEGQPKRLRLKLLIDSATLYYESRLREELGAINSGTSISANSIAMSSDTLVDAIKRCLEAREHVDRMVTPASLIESWLADLVSLTVA